MHTTRLLCVCIFTAKEKNKVLTHGIHRPLGPGMKMAGRAVTVRMVPQRPDIAADKPAGMDSPEYDAFEQASPNNVIVISSVGPWESVGGDIKFLRLKQLDVGGLVTDGSVRDTDILLGLCL